MYNGTAVTVRGNVATDPVVRQTESGTVLCSFRVAVTARRYSALERRPVDVDTSFFTVTCWRQLATNVAASVAKGDGVVVNGRLRVRDFEHDGRPRTAADIVADVVGHDLTWGVSRFEKVDPARRDARDDDESAADALAGEVAAASGDALVTPTDAVPPDGGAGSVGDVGPAEPHTPAPRDPWSEVTPVLAS